MVSQKILISEIQQRKSRDNDHFPNGRTIFLNLECASDKECFLLMELLRSDKIWVTNQEPLLETKDAQ